MQCIILKKFGHIGVSWGVARGLISVNVRFTEGLGQMTWFLQVSFTCYAHTAATYITLNKWLTDEKLGLQYICFSKKSFLLEIIYLLIKFNKTESFLWNTKNTDTNDLNDQIKHIEGKITLERVHVSDIQISAINFNSDIGNVLHKSQVKELQN